MLLTALLIFGAVACAGLYMAVALTRGGPIPPALAMAHGFAGLAALVLLTIAVFVVPHARVVNDALFMFIIAAIGGIFLFLLKRHGALPLPLTYLHGLAAIIAVGLLTAGLAFTPTH